MDDTHLKKAASLFHRTDLGYELSGEFSALYGAVHQAAAISGYAPDRTTNVLKCLACILNDFWTLATLVGRLEWMQRLSESDPLAAERWGIYASADIVLWHVEFRSLLDHAGEVICDLADKRNQVEKSFTTLIKKARAGDQATDWQGKLGQEWYSLLKNVAWYSRMVSIRDDLVHFGAKTLVFCGPKDGILFQVLGADYRRLIQEDPTLMYNENVVYFDRYAAHLTAHLIVFLEKFASIAAKRMRLGEGPPGSIFHFGFETLMLWIESALAAAQAR